MDRGAWQSTVYGVTRVGHDLATKLVLLLLLLNRANSKNKIKNHCKREKKEGKKKTENKSKCKNNNKCFSLISSVSLFSLAVSHITPCLPRMPSNTGLASGSAVGMVQTLIWPYCYLFFPPMTTTTRTNVFSFVGNLIVLLCIP